MEQEESIKAKKRVALIAHASQMEELLGWASFYRDFLEQYDLYTTGEAVSILVERLHFNNISAFQFQPLDLDQRIEPNEAVSLVDFLVFFWVPSEALPDDPDIQVLLDTATADNIPIAGNRSAADFLFPLFLASAGSEIM